MPQKEDQRYQDQSHALQQNAGAHQRVRAARVTVAADEAQHAGAENAEHA
jgi:hypothetical protein